MATGGLRCRSCGCTTGLAATDGAGCRGPLGTSGVCKCHVPRHLWPAERPTSAEPEPDTVATLLSERAELRARVVELEDQVADLRRQLREAPAGW